MGGKTVSRKGLSPFTLPPEHQLFFGCGKSWKVGGGIILWEGMAGQQANIMQFGEAVAEVGRGGTGFQGWAEGKEQSTRHAGQPLPCQSTGLRRALAPKRTKGLTWRLQLKGAFSLRERHRLLPLQPPHTDSSMHDPAAAH